MMGNKPMEMRSQEILDYVKPDKILTIPQVGREELSDYDLLSKKLEEIVERIVVLLQ